MDDPILHPCVKDVLEEALVMLGFYKEDCVKHQYKATTKEIKEVEDKIKAVLNTPPKVGPTSVLVVDENGLLLPMDKLEKSIIEVSIHHLIYPAKVASQLCIGRSTLYRKMKEHGIDYSRDYIKNNHHH